MKKNILALCLGVIFVLLLGEMMIRLFNLAPSVISYNNHFRFTDNPRIVYEIIPGVHGDGDKINKQGFKDTEFVRQKPANCVRIAMLGDSITEGESVPLGKTFSDRLELLLNDRSKAIGSPVQYEVMNFGVGGYNFGAEVELLKTKVLEYSPDIVILNMFYNDDDVIPGIKWLFLDRGFTEEQRLLIIKRYLFNPDNNFLITLRSLLYKSKLYLFLMDRLSNVEGLKKSQHRLSDTERFREQLIAAGRVDPNNSVNFELVMLGFRQIEDLIRSHHFKFLICLHSFLADGEHPNNKIYSEIAKRFNFPYFHMIEHYLNRNISTQAIKIRNAQDDNIHPNDYGHSIIAESLLLELKKNNFIDGRL